VNVVSKKHTGLAEAVAQPQTGLRPIVADSLSERVADQIVEAIGSSRLLPGQRLYEVEIATQLCVSRIPVREALLVLQSQGLLRASPRRGTHVIELDEAWAREVYDTRTALETRCFQRAAAVIRQEPQLITVLDGHIAKLRKACAGRSKPEINRTDLAFHSAVYDLAGSPLLQTLWSAMSRHVMIMFGLETYRHSDLDRIVEEHVMLRHTLLEGGPRDIEVEVARHVIGPFDSKTIAERAYEAANKPR
jgi:DNA-binding GntR family transcriptional regulator